MHRCRWWVCSCRNSPLGLLAACTLSQRELAAKPTAINLQAEIPPRPFPQREVSLLPSVVILAALTQPATLPSSHATAKTPACGQLETPEPGGRPGFPGQGNKL